MFGGLEITFENQMGRNLIELFFSLLVRERHFSEESIGESRSIPFVYEPHGSLGDFLQPSSKIPGLFRFVALTAVAVYW